MTLGFAGFLLFMKPSSKTHKISDENAASFSERWQNLSTVEAVKEIMSDEKLWEVNLTSLPGFVESVVAAIEAIERDGPMTVLVNTLAAPSNGSPLQVNSQSAK